jgi:DNA-binding CsgD family transcriptional regulator
MTISGDSRNQWDKLVSTIYNDIADDNPWMAALEEIRLFVNGSAAGLRISQRGAKPCEYHFIRGPKVTQEDVNTWEKDLAWVVNPNNPPLGHVEIVHWAQDRPNDPVVELLASYDVVKTISYCFDIVGSTEYVLVITRGKEDPSVSAKLIQLISMMGNHFRQAVRLRREILRGRIVSSFQSRALQRMLIAGFLVDGRGHVTPLNETAGDLLNVQNGLTMRSGHLHAVDSHADRELQEAIQWVLSDTPGGSRTRAMSLKRDSAQRDLGIVISGTTSQSLVADRIENCALIFARDSDISLDVDIALLQQLFSFTPAEAKLAVGLAKGLKLEQIENDLNIRHNTARAHLRSIFSKADVSRQSELVHLLANCVAPLSRLN